MSHRDTPRKMPFLNRGVLPAPFNHRKKIKMNSITRFSAPESWDKNRVYARSCHLPAWEFVGFVFEPYLSHLGRAVFTGIVGSQEFYRRGIILIGIGPDKIPQKLEGILAYNVHAINLV